jgi:hypothetical protein
MNDSAISIERLSSGILATSMFHHTCIHITHRTAMMAKEEL